MHTAEFAVCGFNLPCLSDPDGLDPASTKTGTEIRRFVAMKLQQIQWHPLENRLDFLVVVTSVNVPAAALLAPERAWLHKLGGFQGSDAGACTDCRRFFFPALRGNMLTRWSKARNSTTKIEQSVAE